MSLKKKKKQYLWYKHKSLKNLSYIQDKQLGLECNSSTKVQDLFLTYLMMYGRLGLDIFKEFY